MLVLRAGQGRPLSASTSESAGAFAVMHYINRVTFGFQALAHKIGQGKVVFYHQNAHENELMRDAFDCCVLP
ncbi:MAG TPA: hypothetical protein VFA76_02550 [Terriglobales bacterium]|nr:hypothetical protein [Terriglobales bacterium]